MDWLPIVPIFIIGIFLMITWNALSPIRFFKQHREERNRRRKEWDALIAAEAENEAQLSELVRDDDQKH
jgi:hypothetical protein